MITKQKFSEEENILSSSVGIMAYNEAANIGHLLKALREQELKHVSIKEIIVIASGCTDDTEEIVKKHMDLDGRVRLVIQKDRKGKASAVNLFLREASEKILILHSADTIPAKDTIENLVIPLSHPEVGMTGAHPVPVNKKDNFIGFSVCLLWELHHQLSLHYPKMGELIAFRNIFYRIPETTSVDEASIEPLIKGQGYEIRYVPGAVILNKGAETVSDFIRSRRRIFAGHLEIKKKFGYEVSSMKLSKVFEILLQNYRPLLFSRFYWLPLTAFLEFYARFLGIIDFYIYKKEFAVWEIATSTKDLVKDGMPVDIKASKEWS